MADQQNQQNTGSNNPPQNGAGAQRGQNYQAQPNNAQQNAAMMQPNINFTQMADQNNRRPGPPNQGGQPQQQPIIVRPPAGNPPQGYPQQQIQQQPQNPGDVAMAAQAAAAQNPALAQAQQQNQQRAFAAYQQQVHLQLQRMHSNAMLQQQQNPQFQAQQAQIQQNMRVYDSYRKYRASIDELLLRSINQMQRQNQHTNSGNRQDEVTFFAPTQVREQKSWLQMMRNYKIMEMQIVETEAGGANSVKLDEPVSPAVEHPHLQEMRLMHVDVTEEAYWKRCQAMVLARECRKAVQHKAALKHRENLKIQQLKKQKEMEEAAAEQRDQMMQMNQNQVYPEMNAFQNPSFQQAPEVQNPLPVQENVDAEDEELGDQPPSPEEKQDKQAALFDEFGGDEDEDEEEDNDYNSNMSDEKSIPPSNHEVSAPPSHEMIDTNIRPEVPKLQKLEDHDDQNQLMQQQPQNSPLKPFVNQGDTSEQRLEKAQAEKYQVDSELLDEDWWKRHNTPEGLYGPAEEWKDDDDLETRVLNMDLVYTQPKREDEDPKEEKKDDGPLPKKKNDQTGELVELSRWVLEQKISNGLKALKRKQEAEKRKQEKVAMLKQQAFFDNNIYDDDPLDELLNEKAAKNSFWNHQHKEKSLNDAPEKIPMIDTNKLVDKSVGVHLMKGVKIEQPRQQTMEEWFSEKNMEMDIPVLPDAGENDNDGFLFDFDAKDNCEAPRVTGIEEEKTQLEALEHQRYAPNTNDVRFVEQLVSLQKEVMLDEIVEKKHLIEEQENQQHQANLENEINRLEAQVRSIDARQIHKKTIEKPNENKDTDHPPRRAIIQFTRQERTFVAWYHSVFGDQWRLIADIINYHPFTRSHLRSKEQIEALFTNFRDGKFREDILKMRKNYSVQLPSKPWRTCNLPILFQCVQTSSLLNARHFTNFRQVAGIRRKRTLERMKQPQKDQVQLKLRQEPNGELHLEQVQTGGSLQLLQVEQPDFVMGDAPMSNDPYSAQTGVVLGVKRPREEVSQDLQDWQPGAAVDTVERERSAFESDHAWQVEDRQIEERQVEERTAVHEEEKREQRERTSSGNLDDDMFNLEAIDDILLNGMLSRRVPLELNAQPTRHFLRELLEGKYKRRKLTNNLAQQTGFSSMIQNNLETVSANNRTMQITSMSGQGFESAPPRAEGDPAAPEACSIGERCRRSQLNENAKGQDPNRQTPMYFFLQGSAKTNPQRRGASILSECVMMFWFGYFCRKQLQALNLDKLNAMQKKETDKWEREKEYDFFFLRHARNIHKVQQENAKGNFIEIFPQEQHEINRDNMIRTTLSDQSAFMTNSSQKPYVVESTVTIFQIAPNGTIPPQPQPQQQTAQPDAAVNRMYPQPGSPKQNVVGVQGDWQNQQNPYSNGGALNVTLNQVDNLNQQNQHMRGMAPNQNPPGGQVVSNSSGPNFSSIAGMTGTMPPSLNQQNPYPGQAQQLGAGEVNEMHLRVIRNTQPNQTMKIDLKTVENLWGSRSPYRYVADRQEQYMNEDIKVLERARDFLYDSQRTHWIEMSCYWFQLNKNLHPRYLRNEWTQTATYEGPSQHSHMQQNQQQQNQRMNNPVNIPYQQQQQRMAAMQAQGAIPAMPPIQQPVPGINAQQIPGSQAPLAQPTQQQQQQQPGPGPYARPVSINPGNLHIVTNPPATSRHIILPQQQGYNAGTDQRGVTPPGVALPGVALPGVALPGPGVAPGQNYNSVVGPPTQLQTRNSIPNYGSVNQGAGAPPPDNNADRQQQQPPPPNNN